MTDRATGGRLGRRWSDRRRAELLGLDRLHVFVPAIMSVGVVFWLASELRDLVRSSGEASRDKRARIVGRAVARRSVDRREHDPPAARGLRPRPIYLLIAASAIGMAIYVTIGSLANYARHDGYVGDIAWLVVAALGVSLAGVFYGGVAAVVFLRWPDPPTGLSRTLATTALTTRPSDGEEWAGGPSWRVSAGFLSAAFGAGLLSLVISVSPHVVAGFDRRVAGWLENATPPLVSTATDLLLRTETVLVLVALVGLAAGRCRALAVSYGAATAFGLLASVVLRRLVARPRPTPGPLSGMVDSYPSGHVIQAVIIAAFVPLAVATLTRRRTWVAPLTMLLGLAAAGAAIGRIADRLHWPTDVAGGALVGLTLAFGGRWVVATRRSHVSCRGCLWSHDAGVREHQPGLIPVGVSGAAVLRILAHVTGGLVAVVLAVLTLTVGIPSNTEGFVFGASVQEPVQLALTGVISIGALVAWRSEAVGAVLIAFAATVLGIFAAIEYRPVVAVALTIGAMVPAILLWLAWQHRRSARQITALAGVTALLLGTTWFAASAVHDVYFGPTHPDSVAAQLAVDRVDWVWSGALRPDGIDVVARLAAGHDAGALVVTDADGALAVRGPATAADDHRIVRLRADGLAPGRAYRYAVVVDGVADTSRGVGRFRTPVEGPMSFRVALGSCARVGSNGAVFDAIAAEDPLLYLALGDLHYGNIDSTSTDPFLRAFDRLLTSAGQSALYRSTPMAYVWDDHDYGPDGADASAPGRAASRAVYRQVVPHYPLPSDGPVYQAFTIGRVRFVLTDERSERTTTSMLGEEQLTWLIDELTTASRTHALVVWGSTVPWIAAERPGADGWGGFGAERRRIADAIADAGVDNLVMVAGDAHMVAFDDGTNSDYSSTGGAAFPVLHVGALDRPGGIKGGPYSHGTFPGGGHYGRLDIDDDGGAVTVTMSGHTWDGETLVSETFVVGEPA